MKPHLLPAQLKRATKNRQLIHLLVAKIKKNKKPKFVAPTKNLPATPLALLLGEILVVPLFLLWHDFRESPLELFFFWTSSLFASPRSKHLFCHSSIRHQIFPRCRTLAFRTLLPPQAPLHEWNQCPAATAGYVVAFCPCIIFFSFFFYWGVHVCSAFR